MLLKIILISFALFFCEAAFEGELCTKNTTTGICTILRKCKTAIEDIKQKKHPQVCGFEGTDPIVCCFDNQVPTPLKPVTTEGLPKTTTEYVPFVNDDYYDYSKEIECGPIPAGTAKKTGQKAVDKCIEYQEKYVYPCEMELVASNFTRKNYCSRTSQALIPGTDAADNDVTHRVTLGYGKDKESAEWLCGGTIISEKYVLTAGHCIASREYGQAKYILVGSPTQDDEKKIANIYTVKSIIKHPDFKPPSKYNDIALLETNNPLKLSKSLVPACLHTGNPLKDDQVTTTTWGFERQEKIKGLQKVSLSKISDEECSAKFPVHRLLRNGINNSTQMCYMYDKQSYKDSSCGGVGGSSIEVENPDVHCMYLALGITSFGSCYGPELPDVFTRVSAYIPWIESVVWP